MELLCRDCDLMKYEPMLFGDCGLANQVVCRGEGGVLADTYFTSAGADFAVKGVEAGQVIHLYSQESGIDAVLEIAEVRDANELVVSMPRPDGREVVCDLAGSGLEFQVVSYAGQIADVTMELTQFFKLKPGDALSEYGIEDVVETAGLRRAAIYATLAGIFASLGRQAGDDAGCWEKSLYYQRKFERARECCSMQIDVEKDGSVEQKISGGSFRLKRG